MEYISVSSLYEATENELQGPGMTISKKKREGPSKSLISNICLPSDFNVEVQGVDNEVVEK